jgi:hypothetical protein
MTGSFNRFIRLSKLIVGMAGKIAPANPAQPGSTFETCAAVLNKPFSPGCVAPC